MTLQTQLLPDKQQTQKLAATMTAFNESANWLAFKLQSANKVELQKVYYRDLRNKFGMSAQMAIRCIAQVMPRFKQTASIPYDQRRMLHISGWKGLVSK